MNLQFYPYDFDYKIINGKVLVYLYSKLDDGSKVCVVQEYQPFFYATLKNINKVEFQKKIQTLSIPTTTTPAKVVSFEEVEKELLGRNQHVMKIFVNYPKAVPLLSKEIQSFGVECFEKDVLFIHRYLRDLNIIPMTACEATGVYFKNPLLNVPQFLAEKVYPVSSKTISWKILAIDIETYSVNKEIDSQKNPILMIAFYGMNEQGKTFEKVITWKEFPADSYVNFVNTEKELLQECKQIIANYNPDILTGYFSDGFDLPYIKARANIHNVKFDLGLDQSDLIASTADLRDGEAKIKGILHLDMLKFIKYIFGKNIKTDSYSLDSVSKELLGTQKHDVDLDELPRAWDNSSTELKKFSAYNLQDAKLTFQLCEKLLSDIIEFSKIIGLPPFDVTRMRFSRLVESYIMKRAIISNVLSPNKPGKQEIDRRMEESIKGGFVYEPTPGIYSNLVVFDFRSLYPTIIVSHNIGPESLTCDCCKDLPHVPGKEEYWFCEKKKFLPGVLAELVNLRSIVKKDIKQTRELQQADHSTPKKSDSKELSKHNLSLLESRSYALKILANSFYGYLGFFGARWYSLESAASTTAYARHYIKDTIAKAEHQGFQVAYGDTDSCFFQLGKKDLTAAMRFMQGINSDLPGQMELEFEGYFPRGIFVSTKGTTRGAKKKYALRREDGTLKITGFETVRRNTSPLAKQVQEHVLNLVLNDKLSEAVSYVKQIVKDLKVGKVPIANLVIKTQLTRELSKYESIGPHVQVALERSKKGERIYPGMLIEYVIIPGLGLIRDRAKIPAEVNKYDADYYLNHQIIPAVSGIFSVMGYQEDEIFSESTQKGLGSFM
jgi:DNA polymerase, archaea type